ncbi:MAG: hypothetical protein AB4063_23605 [Crocosphaera sp.]
MNFSDSRFVRKDLPYLIVIAILLIFFLIYFDSIFNDQFFLGGHGDIASRFLTSVAYAKDPSKALNIKSWLGVWPPVPFIIQGFVLRSALFPGIYDSTLAIITVQLTGVFLVLSSFYFISRSVALQTNELRGLFAFIMCFCASIPLYLAPTTFSEVYALFFVSFALWNLFRFISKNIGLTWCILSLALAFFCRSESLIIALVVGIFLLFHRRWKSAILLVGIIIALAFSKFIGSLVLVEGVKFFEFGDIYVQANTLGLRLSYAYRLIYDFLRYNKILTILFFISIIPWLYYSIKLIKRQNIFQKRRVSNNQDVTNPTFPLTTIRLSSFRSVIVETYQKISVYVVSYPAVIWIIFFLAAIGILFLEALRGNINAQWRYLYMANVFFAVVIALIAVQSFSSIYAYRNKLAKQLAICMISTFVLFSLWSGFSHATGQKVFNQMPLRMQGVIDFIREHKNQGDRVAYDWLNWKDLTIEVHLLDPSLIIPNQFAADPEVKYLLPERLQNISGFSVERKTAELHAFIHSKHPRFLVLASDSFFDRMQKNTNISKLEASGRSINRIRGYLSPKQTSEYTTFIFQSPYVLPKVKIPFTKVHENKDFIILEREIVSDK